MLFKNHSSCQCCRSWGNNSLTLFFILWSLGILTLYNFADGCDKLFVFGLDHEKHLTDELKHGLATLCCCLFCGFCFCACILFCFNMVLLEAFNQYFQRKVKNFVKKWVGMLQFYRAFFMLTAASNVGQLHPHKN